MVGANQIEALCLGGPEGVIDGMQGAGEVREHELLQLRGQRMVGKELDRTIRL